MRSTDFEFMRKSEAKLAHHIKIAGEHSPFTRGRALAQNVNIQQLPTAAYLNMAQDTSGAVQTFYFVMGYSRVGGPDVVR